MFGRAAWWKSRRPQCRTSSGLSRMPEIPRISAWFRFPGVAAKHKRGPLPAHRMEPWQEPDLYELDTRVAEVKGDAARFERTNFYPGGGGQPHDLGRVEGASFAAEVTEVWKEGDAIWHRLRTERGAIAAGMTLHLSVSRDRRQRLVRMHTAEHILFRSLQNTLAKSLSLVKISLGPERSSLYVRADSLGWGDVLAAERLANTIIWEDRAITHHEMSREEFGRFPRRAQVRINEQRVTAERLRIVEVADFDLSACMGTHCRSTGEVRSIYVLGFGQEGDSWRIDFAADATAEMLLAAGEARNASARLGIPVAQLAGRIDAMLSELERLTERVRALSLQAGSVTKEAIGSMTLVWAELQDVEQKQLVERADSLLAPGVTVCFLNRKGDNCQVLLMAKDLNIDAPRMLLGILGPLGGKGGGRDGSAMGGCPASRAAEVIPRLREALAWASRTL